MITVPAPRRESNSIGLCCTCPPLANSGQISRSCTVPSNNLVVRPENVAGICGAFRGAHGEAAGTGPAASTARAAGPVIQ